MRSIKRQFLETGKDYCLSPEQWLSHETLAGMTGSLVFGDIVDLIAVQATPPSNSKFILDTGNAREGLLDLTVLGNPDSNRVSSKKVARDGDLIISRLRPYLRQVAWLPNGASTLLGINEFYCSTEFFVFRRKGEKCGAGLLAWLLSEPIQAMISDAATGGHHPRINVDLLLNAPVDEVFLDDQLGENIARVLTGHLQGQRELLILLRH